MVGIRNRPDTRGPSSALAKHYLGPYYIMKCYDNQTCDVATPDRRQKVIRIHVENLRPWYARWVPGDPSPRQSDAGSSPARTDRSTPSTEGGSVRDGSPPAHPPGPGPGPSPPPGPPPGPSGGPPPSRAHSSSPPPPAPRRDPSPPPKTNRPASDPASHRRERVVAVVPPTPRAPPPSPFTPQPTPRQQTASTQSSVEPPSPTYSPVEISSETESSEQGSPLVMRVHRTPSQEPSPEPSPPPRPPPRPIVIGPEAAEQTAAIREWYKAAAPSIWLGHDQHWHALCHAARELTPEVTNSLDRESMQWWLDHLRGISQERKIDELMQAASDRMKAEEYRFLCLWLQRARHLALVARGEEERSTDEDEADDEADVPPRPPERQEATAPASTSDAPPPPSRKRRLVRRRK